MNDDNTVPAHGQIAPASPPFQPLAMIASPDGTNRADLEVVGRESEPEPVSSNRML